MDAEDRPTVCWAAVGLAVLTVDALLLVVRRTRVLADRLGPEGTSSVPVESGLRWTGTGDGSIIGTLVTA